MEGGAHLRPWGPQGEAPAKIMASSPRLAGPGGAAAGNLPSAAGAEQGEGEGTV